MKHQLTNKLAFNFGEQKHKKHLELFFEMIYNIIKKGGELYAPNTTK